MPSCRRLIEMLGDEKKIYAETEENFMLSHSVRNKSPANEYANPSLSRPTAPTSHQCNFLQG